MDIPRPYVIGGGVALLAYMLFSKRSSDTENAVSQGGTIDVRLTGYWPYQAGLSSAERLMEGGQTDTHGQPLYTLEMFQRGEAPYVSVSGDDAIWPYGQRIAISAWPGVVFRVVDTGSNFRGLNKVYRVFGREPLDICVDGSSSVVPKDNTTATIFNGDDLRSPTDKKTPPYVVTSGFVGQEVG